VKKVRPIEHCEMFEFIGIVFGPLASDTLTTPTLSDGVGSGPNGRYAYVCVSFCATVPFRLGGHVIVGGSLSTMVIANEHDAVLPARSYAVHVTIVEPSGKFVVDVGIEHVT